MERLCLGRMGRHLLVILLALLAAWAPAQTAGLVREIEIRGLVNVNRETVEGVLRSKAGQPYLESNLALDKRALEELGFFSAVDVRGREVEQQQWVVVVEVVEFPRIKEIRVVGNSVVPTELILKALETAGGAAIAPDRIYNARSVGPAVAAIRKLYSDRGFFADVDEIGPLADSPETVNVSIVELRVNSVTIVGNTRTSKRVMDRLIKTKPGDAYNLGQWETDLRRVFSTQWFETIEPVEREGDEIGKVDLTVRVKEARTGLFNVGFQVDPRSSFAGLLRFTDTNFRGTGQNIGAGFLQGTAGGGPSVDLDWTNPFIDNRDTSLSLSLYSRIVYRFAGSAFGGDDTPTDEDERYYERRTGGSLSLVRPFRRNLFVSAGVRFEQIRTRELETTDNDGFIQQDGDVGSVSVAATLNRRDVDVDPSRGNWIRLQVEPGFSNITKIGGAAQDQSILGRNTFVKTQMEYRAYFTDQPPRDRRELDAPRRVLALRARYGLISGKVPFFEQFFTGGSDSLRGYPEDRFWGRQSASLTLEYRQPIQKAFNAILFADYAGAWDGFDSVNEFTQSRSAKLQLGYGIGFSFRTPLGPIRLDFGFNQDGGSRTHFLIGTSF